MFGVSVRTILRDVDALNLAGIPIVTYQGVNGGISLVEGYRLDKSILTSDDMATIITILKGVDFTMPHCRHEILMEKLKNTLSFPEVQLLNSKVNQMIIDLSPWVGQEAEKEKIASLRDAIKASKEIEIEYRDSSASITIRRVQPYSIVLKEQKWYLYAWCLLRNSFRFFKVSRMKKFTVSETTFKRKEELMEEVLTKDIKYKPEKLVNLELVFIPEMKSIIEEWFQDELIEKTDGSILVNTSLPEDNWLYGFLLSFGMGVEVVNPPHIRKILREISKEIYKKYSP